MTENGELSELEESVAARTLTDLARATYLLAKSKGWHDWPRNFGELIALAHSELSEALENWRDGENPENAKLMFDAKGKPIGIPSELADVIIRVLAMAGYLNIDIGLAVVRKHEYNATRAQRHGGKVA